MLIAAGTSAAHAVARSRLRRQHSGIALLFARRRALPDRGRRRSFAIPSMEKADRWAGVKFYFAVARGSRRRARDRPAHRPDAVLLEKKIGEGRVLLFASGLDNLTNDFPLHPVFVPFVEQTARYLSGTERRSGSRAGRFVPRIAQREGTSRRRRSDRSRRPAAALAEGSHHRAVLSADARRVSTSCASPMAART